MAFGPYNISEHTVHVLLDTYNSVMANDPLLRQAAFGQLDGLIFPNSPAAKVYKDWSGTSQVLGSGAQLFIEYGSNESLANTPSAPIDITTDGASTAIVLASSGDVSLVDNGSAGDIGDIIFAGSGDDSIQVVQGNNLVIAGGGADTLVGGTGADSLWGGGNSVLEAGAGNNRLYGGFNADAHDTLMGGAGSDFLKVYAGNNVLDAGSGPNTLYGGAGADQLVDSVAGGHSLLIAGNGFGQTLEGGASTSSHDTLRGGFGDDSISVNAGDNKIIDGSAHLDSIFSGDVGNGDGTGGDSIVLYWGADAQVSVGGGTATDSVYFGNAGLGGDATISATGDVNIYLQSVLQFDPSHGISSEGGATTLSFTDGQSLTYEGSGHITIHFNSF